ncbi:MAG TPA: PadR family transcriptional regulator [Longimicrobiales bacterium]|nr:PadR family transcriptional regulator [Longimicrobiales bacterium]
MPPNLPSDFEQQVLLAVWRLGDDAYGASVRDELEARTGHDVTQGAVYVTLVRLEKKGLLRSRLSDPTPVRGGKAKRIFGITPEGISGVRETREMMDRLWEGLAQSPRPTGVES